MAWYVGLTIRFKTWRAITNGEFECEEKEGNKLELVEEWIIHGLHEVVEDWVVFGLLDKLGEEGLMRGLEFWITCTGDKKIWLKGK